jgi:hypothetical protein
MGWLPWGTSTTAGKATDDKVARASAEDAMGVLFHKKPVPQASVAASQLLASEIPAAPAEVPVPLAAPTAGPSSKLSKNEEPATRKSIFNIFTKQSTSKRESPSQQEHRSPVESGSPLVDWKLLPPSPIGGFQLQDEGLRDMMAPGQPILSAAQLKSLILEASSLEGQAKATVDHAMPQHVRITMQSKVNVMITQFLGVVGILLILYKVPSGYRAALPRDSLLFRSALVSSVTGAIHWDENTREAFARKHRRLLRMTSRRVAGALACGGAMMATSAYFWDSYEAVNVHHEAAVLGKDQVNYHLQTKISAQWLWTVYFHHPAYKGGASSVVPLQHRK